MWSAAAWVHSIDFVVLHLHLVRPPAQDLRSTLPLPHNLLSPDSSRLSNPYCDVESRYTKKRLTVDATLSLSWALVDFVIVGAGFPCGSFPTWAASQSSEVEILDRAS